MILCVFHFIFGLRDGGLIEYFLAFVSFLPRIADLPTCLCDTRRQVVCSDMGNALAIAVHTPNSPDHSVSRKEVSNLRLTH